MAGERVSEIYRRVKVNWRNAVTTVLFGIALSGDQFRSNGKDINMHKLPTESYSAELVEGAVYYEQRVSQYPFPMMMHIVTVPDISKVGFLVTPPSNIEGWDTGANTTSGFVRDLLAQGEDVRVAVNGQFFEPYSPRRYPGPYDGVRLLGEAIHNGKGYSESMEGYPPICFMENGSIQIVDFECPPGTLQAIAGNMFLVKDGQIPEGLDDSDTHPRTVIGLRNGGTEFVIVAAGGRLPGIPGPTPYQMARFLENEGVVNAINLDGGGSSTLVGMVDGRFVVLNYPVDATDWPFFYQQRNVGNALMITTR
jgi:hypothetical protein